MKEHLKQNWKYYISPVLLLCILLAGLWYWRGVGFAALAPELDPASINVSVMRLDDAGDNLLHANFDVDASSPEGLALLDSLYSLTLHRPPTNLLYQILKSTRSGQMFEEGDYAFVVRVFGTDNSHAAIQFNVRTWSYDTPGQSQYLPCSVEGGQETGRALGEQLWRLAEEFDCIE